MFRQVCVAIVCFACVAAARADIFGTGENQFAIDFVPISGRTNPSTGIPAGDGFAFTGVANDYRMGTYEITNDQWNKFKAAYGTVAGNPSSAYANSPSYTSANGPTNNVSWYEAAQFVNWLNTNTGHHAAYNFTGTQGTGSYTFTTWSTAEAAGGRNLYRHKDAFYYLPTEDEWVKAAYWNGTALQNSATKASESLTQGDGNGAGWNYHDAEGYATYPAGPWDIGSGSQELNGTYDMMGNLFEWLESPLPSGNYVANSWRDVRGGDWYCGSNALAASYRSYGNAPNEYEYIGFRVASVPEPSCIVLLLAAATGVLGYRWYKQRAA
jgi:formylglycine-generating enzyme required for sulfatase activity